MSFYTPQPLSQYHPHDNPSPVLNTPSLLSSGSYQCLSSAGLDHAPRQSESNDCSSALFQNGYMHGLGPSNSHIVALQHQVKQLQIELVQAKTAFLTLESAFNELARNVQLVNPDPTLLGTTACISKSPRASSTIQISPPVSKNDYPDINANGDYIKQSKKAKQEDNTDIELDSQGKKRLRSSESEFSKKRVKVESANSPASTTTSSPAVIVDSSLDESVSSILSVESANSPASTTTSSPAIIVDSSLDESVNCPIATPTRSSPTTADVDISPCAIVSPPDAHKDQPLSPLVNSVTNTALLGNKENESTAGISNSVSVPSIPKRPLVLLINPLAGSIRCPQVNTATVVNATMTPTTVSLAATSSNTEQIPEASSQTSIANVTGPPESITSQSASTALLSSDDGPDNSVSSKKVVKMRPGPKKNGRNLCAFRWLKQVSVGGGSTKEFNVYYSQLGVEQMKLYDTEAVRLEQAGLWTKNGDIADGTMH